MSAQGAVSQSGFSQNSEDINTRTHCSKVLAALFPSSRKHTPILPTELWSLIFDLVIGEEVLQIHHCDHTTFPYIRDFSISPRTPRSQSYDSYRRLRLVCRRFKAILGDPPSQNLTNLSFSLLKNTTRVLLLNLQPLPPTQIQHLCAASSTYNRLVSLDVMCGVLCSDLNQAPLIEFLRSSAEGTFRSVQRLTIRLLNKLCYPQKFSFWALLHRAFPQLVTLAITTDCTYKHRISLGEDVDVVVTFDTVEILHFDSGIQYSGCQFPRLKHSSIPIDPSELEILAHSPHLESLLIPGFPFPPQDFDLRKFPNLKLLGFREGFEYLVPSIYQDHPLEHIWLFGAKQKGDYTSIKAVLDRLPGISRLTVDLFSVTWRSERRAEEVRSLRLASIDMSLRPPRYDGDPILELGRTSVVAEVKEGILKQAWRNMWLYYSNPYSLISK